MSSKKVTIYSDGGADPNPGIGGWGAILIYGEHEKVLSGNDLKSTNNRMELTAAIKALETLNQGCEVEFYTDSQYVRRGITEWIEGWAAKNWIRKGGRKVENADLWQALWAQTKRHRINWHWVKGHAGDTYNERVDKLATKARLAITPKLSLDGEVVTLYVRASCKGNPGPGGWGVVLEQEGETEQFSGWVEETTNNRMELVGVLEGLRQLDVGTAVQLVTVSDYVFQGATNWINGWRKRGWQTKQGKPTANADLWQQLDQKMQAYKIRWINGKGSSLRGLDEAAKLASEAVRQALG